MADDALIHELEQDYAAARADAAERVKIQAAIADRALQSVTLANGGAIVALFTFAGNVAAKGGRIALDMRGLRWAFFWFVGGLALALLAHIAAFVSQHFYYEHSMREAWRAQRSIVARARDADNKDEIKALGRGTIAYRVGLLIVVASIGMFVTGAGAALWSVG